MTTEQCCCHQFARGAGISTGSNTSDSIFRLFSRRRRATSAGACFHAAVWRTRSSSSLATRSCRHHAPSRNGLKVFWWYEREGQHLRVEVLQVAAHKYELRMVDADGTERV